MEFKKYNSIENTYRKKVVDVIALKTLASTFVVQEKVHGANYSLWYDGINYKQAKRTSFLEDNDTFYGNQVIRERYFEPIKALFSTIQSRFKEVTFIVVYGELFGGNYQHKDVPKDNTATKIQKGIQYTPHNDFYAFDLFVDSIGFVDVHTFIKLVGVTNFFYAKTLFEGSLKQALEYPNQFQTKIPNWLNLPPINDNGCEGIIIKPVIADYLHGGSRIILKNKNEKWAEKISKEKKARISKDLSAEGQLLHDKLLTYINSNRLQNVMSKVGEFEPKLIGQIIGLFSKDAQEDFLKDNEETWSKLEKEEQKRIRKMANGQVIEVIKETFMR